MKRLIPQSLLGQLLLLIGAVLLIAQGVNFAIILSGQQRLNAALDEGPAIARFVDAAIQITEGRYPDERDFDRRKGSSFELGTESLVEEEALARDTALEQRVVEQAARSSIFFDQLYAATTTSRRFRGDFGGKHDRHGGRDRNRETLILSAQFSDGQWLNAAVEVPRGDDWLFERLAGSTLAFYALVLGIVIWIALWIARPLRDLTRAARSFGHKQEVPLVNPRGPSDVREAITAFNDMNQRVVGLLDEKDRMLGAIGHDLRSPLTSIRIRTETMEPQDDRDAVIAKIEEMTATLEDILVLARTGRAREALQPVDLGEMIAALVQEYSDLGTEVSCKCKGGLIGKAHDNLMKRAVRNLIDNALAYGDSAEVRGYHENKHIVIEVLDDGPGIPDDQLRAVLEPFARQEASRSRETGGTGLGLTIVKAIAEGHGGTLTLANRPSGGLRAAITF